MKPVDQTHFHDKENGQAGNCFSAFLASALEIPLEDVPHFGHDFPDGEVFHQRIQAFLRPYNLALLTVDVAAHFSAYGVTGVVHEMSGISPRGVNHAVLAIDGDITHDPHPSRAGIKEPNDEWGVFVVLDPSKPAGKFAKAAA